VPTSPGKMGTYLYLATRSHSKALKSTQSSNYQLYLGYVQGIDISILIGISPWLILRGKASNPTQRRKGLARNFPGQVASPFSFTLNDRVRFIIAR